MIISPINEEKSYIETLFSPIATRTKLSRSYGKYPVKVVEDSRFDNDETGCLHIYLIDKVSGNESKVVISVGQDSTLCIKDLDKLKLQSQSSYNERHLHSELYSNSTLFMTPSPYLISSSSNFNLVSNYNLKADSSLLLVDWFVKTEDFTSFLPYCSVQRKLEVKVDQEVIVSDVLDFNTDTSKVFGSIIFIGKKLEYITKKFQSLPHFEPITSLTSIGIKRNRGSSVDLLSMLDNSTSKKSTNSYSNGISFYSYKSMPMNFTCSQIGKESHYAFLLKFNFDTLSSAYRFISSLLEPLESLSGIKPYADRLNTLD